MKIKIETTARLRKNIKGTRREGQRVVEKGTEPCILWAVDETGPKYRETEAHISLDSNELKISVPKFSEFNMLLNNAGEYHFIATFVTGKMAPLCVSVEPVYNYDKASDIEYVCKHPFTQDNCVAAHIKAYGMEKGFCI